MEPTTNGGKNDAVSPQRQSGGLQSSSFKTSLFVAGVLNSALETGLNPDWFEIKGRRNLDGFLDAAFAESELKTPSEKPAREDWSITVRMNADGDSPDSNWKRITASSAITAWKRYAYGKKSKASEYGRIRFLKLLMVVDLHVRGLHEEADNLRSHFDFDGVDDDCFLQVAVCGNVIYG